MTKRTEFSRSDFYFNLPDELIAQEPLARREKSRLMVLERNEGRIEHRHFHNIDDYLVPGDVLVLNNTRVIPARIFFRRLSGGLVEFMLVQRLPKNRWLVICNRTKRMGEGEVLKADRDPDIRITVIGRVDDYLEIETSAVFDDELLERIGSVPLPPYIRREFTLKDRERYQTVYATQSGSAAAPTAGFHFSRELLNRLRQKDIEEIYLTLDVSWGTFQPVRNEDIRLHKMHIEQYHMPEESADRINLARREGRRIVAVGTTSLRVLESTYRDGSNRAGTGETGIFIYPPMKIQSAHMLLTNFHTPYSTLLMLVCAFGGYDRIMNAYEIAVKMRYRFFSYGDAMLIL